MAFLQQFPEFQLQLLLVLWCSLYYCRTLKQKYKRLKEKLDIWFCDQRNCRHKCTCTSQRHRRMWLVALHFPAYVCRSFPSKHTDLLACCSRTSTSSSVAFIATQTQILRSLRCRFWSNTNHVTVPTMFSGTHVRDCLMEDDIVCFQASSSFQQWNTYFITDSQKNK